MWDPRPRAWLWGSRRCPALPVEPLWLAREGVWPPWDSALLFPGTPLPLSTFCKRSLSTYYTPGAMRDGSAQNS